MQFVFFLAIQLNANSIEAECQLHQVYQKEQFHLLEILHHEYHILFPQNKKYISFILIICKLDFKAD